MRFVEKMSSNARKVFVCLVILCSSLVWTISCQSGNCSKDSECPDGQYCSDSQCGWDCKEDRDCSSAQICTSRGKCQGQGNVEQSPSEVNIPNGENNTRPDASTNDKTSAPENVNTDSAQICSPNQSRCDGNTLKTCNSSGTAESSTSCSNGCENGSCKTQGCSQECKPPWSRNCSNTNGYTVCAENPETGCFENSKFIGCQEGNQCKSGKCEGGCNRPEVMVVLDRSSSMQGTRWTYTKSALSSFLNEYSKGGVKFGMRLFPNNQCNAGTIQPIKENHASSLIKQLTAPNASSSTPIAKALSGLSSAFGDPTDSEVVILITDGTETCNKAEDAIKSIKILRSRGAVVHVIAIGSGADITSLDQFAAAGGTEKSKAAKSETELLSVLEGILTPLNLCCQKGISYCGDKCCQAGQTCYKGQCCTPNCNRDGKKRDCGTNNDGCGGSCGTCPKQATCIRETCHGWTSDCIKAPAELYCGTVCSQRNMECSINCPSIKSAHAHFSTEKDCKAFTNQLVITSNCSGPIRTPGWVRCCCQPK